MNTMNKPRTKKNQVRQAVLVVAGCMGLMAYGIYGYTREAASLPEAFVMGAMSGFGLGVLRRALGHLNRAKRLPSDPPVAEPPQTRLDDSGVSPVIGVILMVAITVVLAAIVFVLVSNLGRAPGEIPSLSMTIDGDNFTVAHASPGLLWGDLLLAPVTDSCTPAFLVVQEADGSTPPAEVHVLAGDMVSGCGGHLTVSHRPSNTVIFQH